MHIVATFLVATGSSDLSVLVILTHMGWGKVTSRRDRAADFSEEFGVEAKQSRAGLLPSSLSPLPTLAFIYSFTVSFHRHHWVLSRFWMLRIYE